MAEPTDALTLALSGRYAIERELGSGGMARVYLARDLKHDRQVAVKVLRPELAAALGAERFLREIKLTAGLNHPHILPLLDSGEVGGFLFYAMPFAEGESLRDRLRRERQLPVEDALALAREVADALQHAHGHGVVHRDIKPENILVVSGHAVVADFGIAKAIHAAGADTLTATGVAVGTSTYMSPEQASGSQELDGRSDTYSLGCVLYEMLAGQPPFGGPTAASVIHQHLTAVPPPIESVRPTTPAWVGTALTRALAKAPADRFRQSLEFAEALSRPESTGSPAAPLAIPVADHASAPRGVRPAVRGTGLVLAGIGLAGALVLGVLSVRALRAPSGAPAPAFPRTSIAVLPFDNFSVDSSAAWFAPGLHDELLTHLSRVRALSVTSRSSVMGFADQDYAPTRIASELGVGSYVEGSVQVVGNRLRVIVQLIDAGTGFHLWGNTYDRTLDDGFAIQSAIAREIVAVVGATLTGSELQRLEVAPTSDAEAYRLYLQANEYMSRPGQSRQNFEIAQGLYEKALARDPRFALAQAALAEAHASLYWNSLDRAPSQGERVREAAEAALRLAPGLPEAHRAIGTWHYLVRRDDRRALEEFRVALAGLPGDADAWSRIGQVHRRLGNVQDAIDAHEMTTRLSPRSSEKWRELGVTYSWVRRYAEAVVAYDRAVELSPDVGQAWLFRAEAFVRWRGELDTMRTLLRSPGWKDVAPAQLRLLSWERNADGAAEYLEYLRTVGRSIVEGGGGYVPTSLFAAWVHQWRGDRFAARRSFDSALVVLDSVITARPLDAQVHGSRGLALAGLGRRDEALPEVQWLRRTVAYREDRLQGDVPALTSARILSQVDEGESALDELEKLLGRPSQTSVHTINLDPLLDPIRTNPRFAALLAKYALP